MQNTTGTIEVYESYTESIAASGARLRIQVTGSKFVMGAGSFADVPELRALVDALSTCGIGLPALTIEAVRIDGEKGMITRTTLATYEVLARCAEIARLPAVLEALGAVKKSSLVEIEWDYADALLLRNEWLEACVERASAKALVIAESLGTDLGGIVSVTEIGAAGTGPGRAGAGLESGGAVEVGSSSATGSWSRSRAVTSSLEGLTLAPSRFASAGLRVVFRVG